MSTNQLLLWLALQGFVMWLLYGIKHFVLATPKRIGNAERRLIEMQMREQMREMEHELRTVKERGLYVDFLQGPREATARFAAAREERDQEEGARSEAEWDAKLATRVPQEVY